MSQQSDTSSPDLAFGSQARALLALGLPLVGSHLAQIAITTTDTLMLGWYDVTALAGVSLAGPVYFAVFLVGSGFAWAVMPMVASAAGTEDDRQVRRATRMGLWLVILFGVLFTPPLLYFEEFFLAIGQEVDVSREAGRYMAIAGFGLLPALIVMGLKSYLSALELARIILLVTIVTAILNAILNYVLIFGNWGAPELGVVGAAIASVIGHVVSLVALIIYTILKTPQYTLFKNFHRPDWEAIRHVFKLGWPISLTMLSEVSLFAASSILMGWVGTIALATHGIALQITSIVFMIHVGLSQAITVKAGRAWGRGDHAVLSAASKASLILSAVAVVFTVILFLAIPEILIGAFIDPDDPRRAEILMIGAALLAVAALFQAVDAAQVMALGMLRGVQDTKVPMWMAAIGYWLVGVPTSYLLGFTAGMGGVGIWLGLCLGLAVAGILLQYRFWTRYIGAAIRPA